VGEMRRADSKQGTLLFSTFALRRKFSPAARDA
jgi:hypothetical protein